jgi:preprotein translocase subunit SecE
MSWEDVIKEDSPILTSLNGKERKRLKKVLNSSEPSEYFGQDYAKLGELIDIMKSLDLIKGDKKMAKKMKSLSEQNVDVVATAAKLRKTYEETYRELRKIIYPKSKGLRSK